MLQQTLIALYSRDLKSVRDDIAAYNEESTIWLKSGDIPNSAGNLCLHLIGNINHYFGALLAKNGYVRQRDLEFSTEYAPRAEMLEALDAAIEVMRTGLNAVTDADWEANYPEQFGGRSVTTLEMILHLLTHLNYHRGQINYHRRILGVNG